MFDLIISFALTGTTHGNQFKSIDMDETNVFSGFLIASGATRHSKTDLKHLRSDSLYVSKIFFGIMNHDSMREIMRFLKFDEKETKDERLVSKKLAAVPEKYRTVVRHLKNSTSSSESLTIGEQVSPFNGCVEFKVHMPNKSSKYGIKLRMCCDTQNYHVTNLKISSGKDEERGREN